MSNLSPFLGLDLITGLSAFVAVGHLSNYVKDFRPEVWERLNRNYPWRDASTLVLFRWLWFVLGSDWTSFKNDGLTKRVWIARVVLYVFAASLIATFWWQ